ncbi:MAG: aminotransferase class V-fold PLP-dependent enzyme [Syntrophorhabdales bacterium]|jgi:cysteine desulfurase family protein
MNPVYFDNASTSWPKPPAMMEAMARFNDAIGANPGRSGHRLSIEAARVVYEARELSATAIGAPDPLSIVFTKNATEAINCVLLGLLKPGDHVVTSGMEHNSVMRPLRFLEGRDVELSIVRCSPTGELDPTDAMAAMKKNTKVIVMTHASNVTGTLLPLEALAHIAREHDALLIVDASQTAGSIPIDVVRTGIDILCFTGHKSLMGPQGTGGFYIRKGLEDRLPPLTRGGTGSASEFEEQPDFLPDRFESGTPNAIGLAGLAAGIRFVLARGIDRIHEREVRLTRQFLEGMADIPGTTLYGPRDARQRIAVVSFTIPGIIPSDVAYDLDEQFAILSRPGLHCAPAAHRTLGTFPHGTVRFSFGLYTTEDEISRGLEAVALLSAAYHTKKGVSHV